MLEDRLLRDRAGEIVRTEAVNAEWALRAVSESLHALFSQFNDAYLRERSTDLDDVIGRIQLNLRGSPFAPSLSRLPGPVVLVAGDLTPSEAAELDWDRVLAIVTDVGSSTYHTAIIARSLGIPAVAGLKDATRQIPPGSLVAVDGTRGEVVLEPSGAVLESSGPRARSTSARRSASAGRGASRPARATGSSCGSRPTSSSPRRRRPRSSTEPRGSASSAGVPPGARAAVPDRGAAARRLPPARRADAPSPGDRTDMGRGARASARRDRRAPTRRSGRGRCASCAARPSPSGRSCGLCCERGSRARSGSCSRS